MSDAEQTSFADEADKYELLHTEGGAWVYVEKSDHRSGVVRPYFCPHCFGNKRLSILQPVKRNIWQRCNVCENEFRTRDDGFEQDVEKWLKYFLRRYARARPIIVLIRKTIRQTLWLKANVAEAEAIILAFGAGVFFRLHRLFRTQTNWFGRRGGGCLASSHGHFRVARNMRNGLCVLKVTVVHLSVGPKRDADSNVHS